MFITFEAGEGAGKSTQARALADILREFGHDVVLTREPGGTPLAEELRSFVVEGEADRMDALTELLIFTAARRDHIQRLIAPSLERGAIVICDRYLGSTYALQGAGGTPSEIIDVLHGAFCGLNPDLTIFLEMDPQKGLDRAMGRLTQAEVSEGRFESKGASFHDMVDRIFRTQCLENPEWQSVNADGSIDEVAARVLAVVQAHEKFPVVDLRQAI